MLNKSSKLVVQSFFISLILVALSSNAFAQKTSKIIDLDSKAIENLKSAITSDNPGLRKSGIYFAGKYSADELTETLVGQLKVEKEPELRILLARVLYIIDDQKFLDQIDELALTDSDPKVKRIASAISSAININYSQSVVDTYK